MPLSDDEQRWHRRFAASAFNGPWGLPDKTDRRTAHPAAGDAVQRDAHLERARAALDTTAGEEDRALIASQIAEVG